MATGWTTSGGDAIGNADSNIRLNPTGGEITLNNTPPADTKIKLKDASIGAGKTLTIQGSNGASGDNNGGNIILTPGAKTGTGTDGKIGISTTSPSAKLEVRGDVRISNSSGNPSIIIAPPPTSTPATDRANIQAAIDALPTGGGTVILQGGTYWVD
jgi:hypothetical protein